MTWQAWCSEVTPRELEVDTTQEVTVGVYAENRSSEPREIAVRVHIGELEMAELELGLVEGGDKAEGTVRVTVEPSADLASERIGVWLENPETGDHIRDCALVDVLEPSE